MQPHSFAITTRQAARLRGVEPHVPYSHLKRHGHWDGAVPVKLSNGRLLWPRDAILRAAGFAPDGASAPVDIRAFNACLEAFGLPEDDATLRAFGARSLLHEADHGRDPSYMLDELTYLLESGNAAVSRLVALSSAMDPKDGQRSQTLARLIAETWSSALEDSGVEEATK